MSTDNRSNGGPAAEVANRAVQDLGALLSRKPHSQDPDLPTLYFEWVQGVERCHAAIRDALATRSSSKEA